VKLKNMVPSGKQLSSAKKAFNVAKGAGVLDKVMPSRNGDSDEEQQEGVGDGRRMPIQQSVDVAAPIESVWKLWNKYEDWPKFMHRLESAEKSDPKHVHFQGKVWGIGRDWDAKITEKRTYETIAWTSEDGLDNAGVVTFHKLAPRLTRVELSLDVNPHGPIEKIGRGARFTKRAVRADLHRFKAYAEMNEG
jgi:uncharacterized membrane protein